MGWFDRGPGPCASDAESGNATGCRGSRRVARGREDADIVIFNNHPLSVYGVVEQTIIDGQVYFDREVDLQRRDALEAEKKALMDKEKGSAQRPRVTTDDAGQEELN